MSLSGSERKPYLEQSPIEYKKLQKLGKAISTNNEKRTWLYNNKSCKTNSNLTIQ